MGGMALPPGATLVDNSPMPLPPGATLVAGDIDPTAELRKNVAAYPQSFQRSPQAHQAQGQPDSGLADAAVSASTMGAFQNPKELLGAAGDYTKKLYESGKGLASLGIPQSNEEAAGYLAGAGPTIQVLKTGKSYYDAVRHHLDAAENAANNGDSQGALFHSVAAGLPLVGPLMGDTYEKAKSGDLPGALASGAAGITQAATLAPEGSTIPNPIDAVVGAGKAVSPALETAGNRAAGATADLLRQSASKDLEQVLGATKEKMKAAASEHVVPGMIERGMTGLTRQGILDQANQIVAENGPKVQAALDDATAKGITFPIKPLIDQLEGMRDEHQVKNAQGEVTAERPEALSMIDSTINTLKKYGSSMTPDELAKLRRFWDTDIANSRKGFLLDQNVPGLAVKRDATNAIRGVINDNLPDVAAANKEYSFGSDLKSVLEATLQRTASQSELMRHGLRAVTGGSRGATIGGALGGAIGGLPGMGIGAGAGAAVGDALAEVMDTTAWKTLSSAAKTKIANALAEETPKSASGPSDPPQQVPMSPQTRLNLANAQVNPQLRQSSGEVSGTPQRPVVFPHEVQGQPFVPREENGELQPVPAHGTPFMPPESPTTMTGPQPNMQQQAPRIQNFKAPGQPSVDISKLPKLQKGWKWGPDGRPIKDTGK